MPLVHTHQTTSIQFLSAWALVLLATAFGSAVSAAEPLEVVSVLQHRQALSRPHDIEVQDGLAFVAGKGGSVAVVDVADAKNPQLVWWKHDPKLIDDAQTVLPLPGTLLLGARDFFALDISNSQEVSWPGRVSDRQRVDRINGMVRRGNYVFTANKTGWVSVIDITQPHEPKLHDALNARERGDLHSPHDIATWEDYLAVVSQSRNSTTKLRLFRIADPQSHALLPCDRWEVLGGLDRADLLGANRVMVAGGFAYTACSQQENFTLGITDVRSPAEPHHVKTLPFAGQYPTGLTVAGRVLFAAGGRTIQAIDISDPANPHTLAVLHSNKIFPSERDNAHDLVYHSGLIYVTAQNDDQLGIVRVNDERILKLAEAEPQQ